MDDWADLQDALLSEFIYGSEIPPARPDAKVTLESLPTELLQSIIDYSKNKSVLSLMRVNRLMHSVALRKFYSNVYLPGEHLATLFRSLDASLTVEQILPSLFHKKYGVLGGLLRSRQHLAVLKTLHIVTFPYLELSIFNRILRYIIENAVSIHTIEFPKGNTVVTSKVFDGMVVPTSLDTLNSEMFYGDLAQVILQTSHLRSLCMSFQCAETSEWLAVANQMSDTLRHLQCYFHVPKEEWNESGVELQSFASKLVHLEELEFGFCECYSAFDPTVEPPVKHYALVAAAIPSLKSITIVDRRNGSFQRHVDIANEQALVSALSHANTNLREISIMYMYRPHTSNYDGRSEQRILWAASPDEIASVSKGVKGQLCIWTPAPNLRSRWPFWCSMFGDFKSALNAMGVRWGPQGWAERTKGTRWHPQPQPHLPSLDELTYFMRVLEIMRRFETNNE